MGWFFFSVGIGFCDSSVGDYGIEEFEEITTLQRIHVVHLLFIVIENLRNNNFLEKGTEFFKNQQEIPGSHGFREHMFFSLVRHWADP
jgi:hypothetical protein